MGQNVKAFMIGMRGAGPGTANPMVFSASEETYEPPPADLRSF